ncbi:MAG: hypothetical protein A3F72_06065 [Bacteroidetes bacterium RIFCSPLOWO2_12_FULL_35_15]|nr:MAG: hypothetical protein A3F72_06065 [Bacteroidetes bacterium RIFCSPLOWO2_12_FULL_35_15]
MQEMYKMMNEHHIIMMFKGDLTHRVVTSLLSSVNKTLDSIDTDYQLKKRFYAIAVECMENITRHNVVLEQNQIPVKYNSSVFAISENDDHFKIQTGNYILNNQIQKLTNKLKKINSLNEKELKAYYKKNLLKAKPEGGGLGIIDMSIRSGYKLSYEFKPCSSEISFFILQTLLNK